MIGNAADALIALSHPDEAYVSEGCSRKAYLISNVLYKVEYDAFEPYWNAREMKMHSVWRRRIATAPVPMAVPEMSAYEFGNETVVACEYIDGLITGAHWDNDFNIACSYHDICVQGSAADFLTMTGYDTSYGNIIVRDGILWLIDLV